MDASGDDRPFEGLKVVDLSQGVAGPHCGMLFAQHGADVVKIEPPAGDWGRAIGTQYGDFCAYNIAFNRGKRSFAVDLKSDIGFEAVHKLMLSADVIVENYRPGVLARFGLDYAAISAANPDVIYVSVTGFGQTGPRSALPATDSILQSYSGLMSVNRDERGMPQRIGVLVIDVVTGLYAFQGASTALYRRATRGGGKHITVSLMDSVGAVQAGKMIEFHLEGGEGKKPGVPVATYATADGFMTINARRDNHFRALCELLGCSEFIDDPRFATPTDRLANEDALMPTLRERVSTWTNEALSAGLTEKDILHGPVNDYTDYFADPHTAASAAVQWMEHPGVGRVPLHRIPNLDTATTGPLAFSPAIGQHTRDVLTELGYSDEAVDAAVTAGAVRI